MVRCVARGVLWVVLLWWTSGCGTPPPPQPAPRPFRPPPTFTEADLIGHWKPLFETDTRETLLLAADHTFIQTFRSVDGSPIYETSAVYSGGGTWRVEQRASGCVYLHLEGMKYFYSGPFAEYGNRLSPTDDPYPFWEGCEGGFIRIPDKMILTVIDRSRFPRGVGLLYPTTEAGHVRGPELLRTDDGTPAQK